MLIINGGKIISSIAYLWLTTVTVSFARFLARALAADSSDMYTVPKPNEKQYMYISIALKSAPHPELNDKFCVNI